MNVLLQRLQLGLESYWSCSRSFFFTIIGETDASEATTLHSIAQTFTRFRLGSPFGTNSATVEDGSDWVMFFLQCLLVHAVSWWGRWYVFEPLARRCMKRPTRRNVMKFSAIATANLFHSLSAFFAWRVLFHKDWLWKRSEWSVALYEVEADVKLFYLLYAARYVSDVISLFFEIPKEDTWAFGVHHAASVGLVLGSAASGRFRIGCVFMFFLDWVDIVLTAAKLLKYMSKARNDVFQILADRLFELFAVSFIVTRNGMLNYVAYVCLVDFENASLLKAQVLVLVGLMTYWMVIILKHAIHQLFGDGSIDDLRESDDEEDGDDDDKKEQ